MNESKHIECPVCGSELDDEKDVCTHCGTKIERHNQEIEIEYKEFPKSEFLEIRKKFKSENESPEISASVERNINRGKMPVDTTPVKASSETQSRSNMKEAIPDINKKPLLVFLAGLLAAGILAWGYYILKRLF